MLFSRKSVEFGETETRETSWFHMVRLRPVFDQIWEFIRDAARTEELGQNFPDAAYLEPRVLLSATAIAHAIEELASLSLHENSGSLDDLTVSPVQQTGRADSVVVTSGRELVVIDALVADTDTLLADLHAQTDRNFEVLALAADQDGVQQISAKLASWHDVSAIHMVTHSEHGNLRLGNVWLGANNLEQYRLALSGWQASLTADADILLYGCDLAGSDHGQAFVNQLAAITGADIAASVDATGNSRFDANWDLEYAVGTLQTDLAFTMDVQQNWDGKLSVITVTTFDDTVADDGLISLREAIALANDGDTIVLAEGNYRLSIPSTQFGMNADGDLDITKEVFIVGAGKYQTVIDGDGIDRVLDVHAGGHLTLRDLTITGGQAIGTGQSGMGGGILVRDASATLTLERVLISKNNAIRGAGIFSVGTVTIVDSTIADNGIGWATDLGGGVYAAGSISLNRVTLHGNQAVIGGGIFQAAGSHTLSLHNVTVSGNHASAAGGGLYAQAAAEVSHSTFTLNHADIGGGIRRYSGTMTINNSIVAQNDAHVDRDIAGAFSSTGNNIFGSPVHASYLQNNDVINVDAKLTALADNGGTVWTHALQVGSPAIDHAQSLGGTHVDARNYVVADGRPDSGAFQANAFQMEKIFVATGATDGTIQVGQLGSSDFVEIVSGAQHPSQLFVDSVNGWVYWSEYETGSIRRANFDGTDVQTVVTGLSGPKGLVVDVREDKIYWAENSPLTNRISSANLDGSQQQTVVDLPLLSSVDRIVVDLPNQHLYWNDSHTRRIERVNLDGTERQTVHTSNRSIFDFDIDFAAGQLFWYERPTLSIDPRNGSIHRSNLDGTDAERIVSGLARLERMQIDHASQQLLWTTRQSDAIYQSNFDGSALTTLAGPANVGVRDIALGRSSLAVGQPPTAESGGPYQLYIGQGLIIDGSGSTDPAGLPLTYGWDLNNDGHFIQYGESSSPQTSLSWQDLNDSGISAEGIYQIRLRVENSEGEFDVQSATLTVLNNPPLVITSPAEWELPENESQVTTITVQPADRPWMGITYALSGGPDAALFALDEVNGTLEFINPPDFEQPLDVGQQNTYHIQVTVSDLFGSQQQQAIVISVLDVNEYAAGPIVDLDSLPNEIARDAPIGTQVGLTVFAEDLDGSDTVSYSLLDSADGRVAINPLSGVVTLAQSLSGDFASSFNVVVQALSTDGSHSTAAFEITVVDIPAPDPEFEPEPEPEPTATSPDDSTTPVTEDGAESDQAAGNRHRINLEDLILPPALGTPGSGGNTTNPSPTEGNSSAASSASQWPGHSSQSENEQSEREASLQQALAASNSYDTTGASGSQSGEGSTESAIDIVDNAEASSRAITPGLVAQLATPSQRTVASTPSSNTSQPSFADIPLVDHASVVSTTLGQPQLVQALQSMRTDVRRSLSPIRVSVGASLTATTGATVGYVVWVIRGGVLVSSVMANLPMWRLIDPMAILHSSETLEEDNESLESMVDQTQESPLKEQAQEPQR